MFALPLPTAISNLAIGPIPPGTAEDEDDYKEEED
jgi:hypothetical protein